MMHHLHGGCGLVSHIVRLDMCGLRMRRPERCLRCSVLLGGGLSGFGLSGKFLAGNQNFIKQRCLEVWGDQLGSCLLFLVGGGIFVGLVPLGLIGLV